MQQRRLFIGDGAEFCAEVILTVAHIAGELDMGGAIFHDRVVMAYLDVGKSLLINSAGNRQTRFAEVVLLLAQIGGSLAMGGSNFTGEVVLAGANIKNELQLMGA